MEKSQAIQKEIELESKVCKNLAVLAEENGCSVFSPIDIDEMASGALDSNPDDILMRLKKAHRVIHEALYAPPRK